MEFWEKQEEEGFGVDVVYLESVCVLAWSCPVIPWFHQWKTKTLHRPHKTTNWENIPRKKRTPY